MVDAFIGEIRPFVGNFAPRYWLFCHGQDVPIVEYQAFFAVIGTTYGGDGRTYFRVPNLKGRTPIGAGHAPGLSYWQQGDYGGHPEKVVTERNIPAHRHAVMAMDTNATSAEPGPTMAFAKARRESGPPRRRAREMYRATQPDVELSPDAGGDHGDPEVFLDNYQPSLVVDYIICFDGYFPPRS